MTSRRRPSLLWLCGTLSVAFLLSALWWWRQASRSAEPVPPLSPSPAVAQTAPAPSSAPLAAPGWRSPDGPPPPPDAANSADGDAPPAPAAARPSPCVSVITGQDSSQRTYRQRATALRQLTRHVSPTDRRVLLAFLDERFTAQQELSIRQLNSLKNDVLDVLLKQETPPPGLSDYLLAMCRDAGHDDVWRDYCLQYLPECAARQWPDPVAAASAPGYAALTNVIWETAADATRPVAGTALLALQRLAAYDAAVDLARLGALAAQIAADDAAAEGARITAFSLAVMQNRAEVLPAARLVAQTGATVVLQMAALRALGELGAADDVELLRALSAHREKRLAATATRFAARLQERLAAPPG